MSVRVLLFSGPRKVYRTSKKTIQQLREAIEFCNSSSCKSPLRIQSEDDFIDLRKYFIHEDVFRISKAVTFWFPLLRRKKFASCRVVREKESAMRLLQWHPTDAPLSTNFIQEIDLQLTSCHFRCIHLRHFLFHKNIEWIDGSCRSTWKICMFKEGKTLDFTNVDFKIVLINCF